MPKIQAVTDEMIARAGVIGQNISRMEDSQGKMIQLFRNMGRNFGGRVPTLMTQHILAVEGEFRVMNRDLKRYKDFLEDAARNYEWTDQEAARWATSIESNGSKG